jgi:hypothetical protein
MTEPTPDPTEDQFLQEIRRRLLEADAHPERILQISLEELAERVGPAAVQALEDAKAEQAQIELLEDQADLRAATDARAEVEAGAETVSWDQIKTDLERERETDNLTNPEH